MLGVDPADGAERWGAVLEEGGEVVGCVFLSRAMGQVLGHDMECRSKDQRGALLLWSAARRQCRAWGAERVLVHFHKDDDPMRPFWESKGFEKLMTVYVGDI